MENGILIVLTGRTASGKDTIQTSLLSRYPTLKRVVTTTSRRIRPGERDGIDYHFLTAEEFKRKIATGDFLEYVEYGGNFYGTTKVELANALKQDTIWRIDPSRAGKIREFIKRSFPKDLAEQLIKRVLVIYITVSDEVVLERLGKRNLSEEEIDKRMADDAAIWQEFGKNYDYVIENVPGKLDQTIEKIVHIIETHKESRGSNVFNPRG